MNKQYFTTKIYYIFEDKNIQKPSIDWLNGLFEKCKDVSQQSFDAGVDKLISIPQDQWNDIYGFKGRPSIIDLVEILTGDRPLTDEEKAKKIADYEKQMKFYAAEICSIWLDEKYHNIEHAFIERYRKPENEKIRAIIDKFAKVKEELSDKRLLDLAEYLKKELRADKQLFFDKLVGIAKEQNKCPYELKKPALNQFYKEKELLTLKKM